MNNKLWLTYALITMGFWGLWGALTGYPAQNGFPDTLVYCVWALTMIPPALVALYLIKWKLQYDKKSILLGCIIGFLGAGGQMVLFHTVNIGPTYLIFPIISLSPIVTILLSVLLLKERTGRYGFIGIVLALIALPLFDYSPDGTAPDGVDQHEGTLWFVLSLTILGAWGLQAFFIKLSNNLMQAESIFFYMMITGLLLIPVAMYLTDFSVEINYGLNGPYLAAAIQILNAIGALCLVYAFRYGKAIVVSPLTNAGAPLITAIIAMILMGVIPGPTKIVGLILAIFSALLLALEPEDDKAKIRAS